MSAYIVQYAQVVDNIDTGITKLGNKIIITEIIYRQQVVQGYLSGPHTNLSCRRNYKVETLQCNSKALKRECRFAEIIGLGDDLAPK